MTGRLREALISCVQRLRRRQSSPGTVAAAPRCSTNASSSEFARFFPSVLKCAESWFGHTRPYCSAFRIPFQGSGLTGGTKRLAPAVEAPYGTPLKMYTPFRLKPRIFPAFVSATVAVSVAMTVLLPQPLVVNFVFGGASGVACAIAVAGKMTEPANPAPRVAMPPMKKRRPLEVGADW